MRVSLAVIFCLFWWFFYQDEWRDGDGYEL